MKVGDMVRYKGSYTPLGKIRYIYENGMLALECGRETRAQVHQSRVELFEKEVPKDSACDNFCNIMQLMNLFANIVFHKESQKFVVILKPNEWACGAIFFFNEDGSFNHYQTLEG